MRSDMERKYREYVERWKAGLETGACARAGEQISRHVRRYMVERYGEKCTFCGWAEKHPTTGKIPVALDHVDGDWSNNTETNLRFLCPNHHSLTPTYGSLNRGRGRAERLKQLRSSGGPSR